MSAWEAILLPLSLAAALWGGSQLAERIAHQEAAQVSWTTGACVAILDAQGARRPCGDEDPNDFEVVWVP